jgi:rifampicin phosphotransferase
MTGGSTSINPGTATEIAVEWVYPGAEAYEWMRDTEHWPAPMPPMELWLHKHWPSGLDRAWEEVGMEAPAVFYRFQYAGPFLYARESPYEPERMLRNVLRYREVSAKYGGPLKFWQNFCRPRVERVCQELAASDGSEGLLVIAELWAYGFHQTFTSLALLFEPGMRLSAMLAEASGEDAPLVALEVLQGGENATQAIDAEIWELAELARRTPAVKRVMTGASDEDLLALLRREPDASAFLSAFDALIDRHGSRSQGWELVMPTWRERPEAPLSLIRAQLASGSVSPAQVAAGSEARRREATERALSQLPSEKHEEFSKTVARLDGIVCIREDRAYWQMVLAGEVRALLLRIGARMVTTGAIDRADDVFLLEPEDIEGNPSVDARGLVAERRAAWELWREIEPPAVIGTLAAKPSNDEAARDELRGSAASRGVATGTARIIHSPEEGARLRRGDILVCAMSTPAWTPLFAIVAGIVTETGGPLSHPAITAREYGIPAVVAVKGATDRIGDGQTITVDGGAGIVRLNNQGATGKS